MIMEKNNVNIRRTKEKRKNERKKKRRKERNRKKNKYVYKPNKGAIINARIFKLFIAPCIVEKGSL